MNQNTCQDCALRDAANARCPTRSFVTKVDPSCSSWTDQVPTLDEAQAFMANAGKVVDVLRTAGMFEEPVTVSDAKTVTIGTGLEAGKTYTLNVDHGIVGDSVSVFRQEAVVDPALEAYGGARGGGKSIAFNSTLNYNAETMRDLVNDVMRKLPYPIRPLSKFDEPNEEVLERAQQAYSALTKYERNWRKEYEGTFIPEDSDYQYGYVPGEYEQQRYQRHIGERIRGLLTETLAKAASKITAVVWGGAGRDHMQSQTIMAKVGELEYRPGVSRFDVQIGNDAYTVTITRKDDDNHSRRRPRRPNYF